MNMGHKVSTISDAMTYPSPSKTRRRTAALSVLTMTLVITSCDCFTSSPPPFFAAATSSSRKVVKTPFMAPAASAALDPATAYAPRANFIQESKPSGWKRSSTRQKQKKDDCERRKREWADLCTSVHSLREAFGENQNKLWGDLDASTSRRLYKTLLPRALLELYRLGLHPEELAPLAYQARVAAKLYARERCMVPARIAAMGYDGFRQWKRYGKFQVKGMSYDQVWDKYEAKIMEEMDAEGLTSQDVTAKICLKILERSCQTNEGVDRLFLRPSDAQAMAEQKQDMDNLTHQLEKDVRAILEPGHQKVPRTLRAQRVFALRMVARAKRRLERMQILEDEKRKVENKDLHRNESNETKMLVRPWNDRSNKMNSREKVWQDRSHPGRSQ